MGKKGQLIIMLLGIASLSSLINEAVRGKSSGGTEENDLQQQFSQTILPLDLNKLQLPQLDDYKEFLNTKIFDNTDLLSPNNKDIKFLLVYGPPNYGKTFTFINYAKLAQKANIPCLYIKLEKQLEKADQADSNLPNQIFEQLGLQSYSLLQSHLVSYNQIGQTPILIIDDVHNALNSHNKCELCFLLEQLYGDVRVNIVIVSDKANKIRKSHGFSQLQNIRQVQFPFRNKDTIFAYLGQSLKKKFPNIESELKLDDVKFCLKNTFFNFPTLQQITLVESISTIQDQCEIIGIQQKIKIVEEANQKNLLSKMIDYNFEKGVFTNAQVSVNSLRKNVTDIYEQINYFSEIDLVDFADGFLKFSCNRVFNVVFENKGKSIPKKFNLT